MTHLNVFLLSPYCTKKQGLLILINAFRPHLLGKRKTDQMAMCGHLVATVYTADHGSVCKL